MSGRHVYLIDASIYIFRAWFSIPPRWQASNGHSTHAVYGYLSFLLDLLQTESPLYAAAAFDESLGGCFRNEIYPQYKCRRNLPDEELAFQLDACKRVTALLGLETLVSDRFEADDLLAAAAARLRAQGDGFAVLSRDKDLVQLMQRDGEHFRDYPAPSIDRHAYQAQHAICPVQVPELLALTGDSVDDIPGVPGIGRKTALALLVEYPDVEAVLANLDRIAVSSLRGAARIARLLHENRDQVRMARRLTGLAEHALDGRELRLRIDTPDTAVLREFAEEHGLGKRMTERLERIA